MILLGIYLIPKFLIMIQMTSESTSDAYLPSLLSCKQAECAGQLSTPLLLQYGDEIIYTCLELLSNMNATKVEQITWSQHSKCYVSVNIVC